MSDTRHTPEFKIEALHKLKANNYNIQKTANELNVARGTLMKWRDIMGPAVYKDRVKIVPLKPKKKETEKKSKKKETAIEIVDDKSEAAFVEKSRNLRDKVIERLTFLVENNAIKSNNILIDILRVTHAITQGTVDAGQTATTLIQQVNSFCIQYNQKLNNNEIN